jgi:hypothetical protein
MKAWSDGDLFSQVIITNQEALGGQMLTMAHELGHRVDWDDVGYRTERIWRSQVVKDLQAKYAGDWLQHLDEVVDQETRAVLEMARLARTFDSMKEYTRKAGAAYTQYFYDIKEVWARGYSQWIADVSGNPEMLANLATRIAQHRQFTEAEMAMLRPHIETVLRARGLMK